MKKSAFYLLMIGLLVISFAFINGCGSATSSGGGGGTSTNRTYYGTQSPGDAWKWEIGSSTFFGTNETSGFWVSGTYTTLPSGFGKAHVTNSLGGTATGSDAYFMEFPNTMLLVRPTTVEGSEDKVIVCPAAASSLPTDRFLNWVTIPWSTWDTSENAYGTVEATYGDTTTFEVWFYDINGAPSQPKTVESGWVFSDGHFSRGASPFVIFMSPSGVFGADQGAYGGIAGGKATSFTSTEVNGRNFRGVLFKYYTGGSSGTGETEPIGAQGRADGTIFGGSFNNTIDTATDPDYSTGVTLEFISIINGVGTGNLKEPGGSSSPFNLIISKIGDSNKIMVFGITSSGSRVDNFLVMEQ